LKLITLTGCLSERVPGEQLKVQASCWQLEDAEAFCSRHCEAGSLRRGWGPLLRARWGSAGPALSPPWLPWAHPGCCSPPAPQALVLFAGQWGTGVV